MEVGAMAGFLGKLLGRSPAVPPEVEAAREELAKLAQDRPGLAGPAAVLVEILPALFAEPVRETPPTLSPEQATNKLLGGVPLLRVETVGLDLTGFRRRWLAVCAALENREEGGPPRALGEALRAGRLNPGELTQHVLAGRPEEVHALAEKNGFDPGALAFVLRLTLLPVLAHLRGALNPLHEGAAWRQGHCPTCGAWPLLGEFRGLEQKRWLRCGLCAGEWEWSRLRCPFCANADHRTLGYFHAEGEEAKWRAATCDACGGYVKMASTLQALTAPQLLVVDLATTHLDLAAAERGYLLGG
jgi:FdhE protein